MPGNFDEKLLSGLFAEYKQMMFKIAMGILNDFGKKRSAEFGKIYKNRRFFKKILKKLLRKGVLFCLYYRKGNF